MPTRPVLRAARSRALRAFNKKVRNTARARRANARPASPTLQEPRPGPRSTSVRNLDTAFGEHFPHGRNAIQGRRETRVNAHLQHHFQHLTRRTAGIERAFDMRAQLRWRIA